MIGETLHNYRIEALLGAGGMGEVYRAEDLRLGRPVALKFLSPEHAGDPEWRERLAREARAASTLSSPFVAATYELGEHDDRQFIAMEYVDGELLSKRLAKSPLSLDRAVRLGLQVGEALEEAHERGVIHRDIKPGNLMLTRHSRVKVLDFGLAKLDASILPPADREARTLTLSETQPGMLLGTVSYMSPEQALGRAVDKRTDLFSLGVVLYQSICGELPFAGETPTEMIAALLRDPPRQLQPMPAEPRLAPFARIVGWCLEKEPDYRPQSARELIDALEELRQSSQSGALSTSTNLNSSSSALASAARSAAGASILAGDEEHLRVPVVAVLPFSNISGAAEDDWIGTGIAETVTTDLKASTELTVLGREQVQSALRAVREQSGPVADDQEAAIEVGRRLGACAVILGGVQRLGDRLRITARGVDVRSGEVHRVVKLDGSVDDLFTLQDRVVRELAAGVSSRTDESAVTGSSEDSSSQGPPSLEAFESFSRGVEQLRLASKGSLQRAIALFERAVELHPTYALAWAMLAAARQILGSNQSRQELLELGVEAGRRAVELDPRLAQGHQWLGAALAGLGEEAQAQEHLETAVRLDPTSAIAHTSLARLNWMHLARVRRGLEHLERAAELDPDAGYVQMQLGFLYALAGDYSAAERACRKAIELQHRPLDGEVIQIVGSYLRLGFTFYRRQRWADALREYRHEEEFLASVPDHALRERTQLELHQKSGAALLRKGDRASAERRLRLATEGYAERRAAGSDDVSTRYYTACAHALLGEGDRAVELFEECVQALPSFTRWRAATDPDLESVRARLDLGLEIEAG